MAGLRQASQRLPAILRCTNVSFILRSSQPALGGFERQCTGAASSCVIEIGDDKQFDEAVHSTKDGHLAVFDFTAKWCGPCRHVAPHYDDLSNRHPRHRFYKVDIDSESVQKSVEDMRISAVPTFIFMKQGEKVAELNGADVSALQRMVDELGG